MAPWFLIRLVRGEPTPVLGLTTRFMQNLESQTLGKYRLLKELGRGMTGTVYLGRDRTTSRDVAVKVAHFKPGDTKRTLEKRRNLFFNEARAAQLLAHPNIVAVYDTGEEDELFYIAMEHVPGGQTLDNVCTPGNLLPIDEAVKVATKCALALDYAHRHGVIHRDLKPRNILLTSDNEVKVGDFGLAMITGQDAADTLESLPGSPLYMSPEQILGQEVSAQSDLFALGVVMYELLTGKHPFVATLIPAISHNITHKPQAAMREWRTDIPEALERIVDRALKKHPGGRYRTGMDIAGDLAIVFDNVDLTDQDSTSRARFEQVRKLVFFGEFSDPEVWELLNVSHWQDFEPGQQVLQEGELGDSFFVLVSGEVSVSKGNVKVDVLGEGSCFGEIGFITQRKRMASITAKSWASVIEIRAPLINRVSLNCQLRFHKAFIETMSERLLRCMETRSRARV